MNVYQRICADREKRTKLERKIIQHISDNYPDCLLNSATIIANQLGVSPATVVRFFAKLGYASFGEMQRELRSEIMFQLPTPALRAASPLLQKSSSQHKLGDAFALDKSNIDSTSAALDIAEFEKVIDLITNTKRRTLYIAGAKNSRSVALYLATHLNMCIPNVRLISDNSDELTDSLLWINDQDVLLVFSIRRYSATIFRAAQYFHKIGVPIVSFVDDPTAPIGKLSQHKFQVFTQSESPFDSYTAAFSLCTALINAVTSHNPKATEQTLRTGEEIWKYFNVFVEDS